MNIKTLLRYFILPIYRPLSGLKELLQDKKRVAYAAGIFLFLGIIYTLSVQIAYSRGIGAAVEPFVKIPAEDYYYWQRFWQIPFFFLATILFAGIVRLLSLIVHGSGRFEDTFAVLCIAQTFPMFITMWLPETIEFLFFPGRGIYALWFNIFRQILGIVWPLAVTVVGITLAEKIKWYYSIMFTFIAAVPMTGLMVIFVR
jgi:hypothetical protein